MNSRRQKKVDTPLSVDLLEDRCLPSALASVPVVAEQALKIAESVTVLVADVHPGSSGVEARAEHQPVTAASPHDTLVVSVGAGAEQQSDDRIPAHVTVDVATNVVTDPVHAEIDASHARALDSEAASVEVAVPFVEATIKATIGVAASTSVPGSTSSARPAATPNATPATVAAGKVAAEPAVQFTAPAANLDDGPSAAIGMARGIPANLPRPEIPGTTPGHGAPPLASAPDGPAAGNLVPGAVVALAADPVADDLPRFTEVSAAPASNRFFSPLGGDLIADLPIYLPDFAAVERAFDQLAEYVGLDAVRGGGSWLLAAAMAAASAEVARRQMKPRLDSGVPPDDGPPPGWLPEGNEPMPGDDGHA